MEYYGEKPKKFTKKWWPYFWDYYKWHTIVIAFIVISIIVTVVEVKNQEKYDGDIVTVGGIALNDEQSIKLKQELDKSVDDIDKNGKKSVLVEQLIFSQNDTDAQYAAAMRTKYELKLQTDESFAFIMDKDQVEKIGKSEEISNCFAKTDEWLSQNVDEKDLYSLSGKTYAVKLTDSKLLKEIGIDGSNLYAVLRYNYKPDKEELNNQFENAKKILNEMVKK